MTEHTEGWLACREEAAKVCKAYADFYSRPLTTDNARTCVAVAERLYAEILVLTPPQSEQADQRSEAVSFNDPCGMTEYGCPICDYAGTGPCPMKAHPTPSAEASRLADVLEKDLTETTLYHVNPVSHTATFTIGMWKDIIAIFRKEGAT